jgi:hypothetical protein
MEVVNGLQLESDKIVVIICKQVTMITVPINLRECFMLTREVIFDINKIKIGGI